MTSIRTRLLRSLIISGISVCIIGFIVAFTLIGLFLEFGYYDLAQSKALTLAGLLEVEDGDIILREQGDVLDEFETRDEFTEYFQIWNLQGKEIARSNSLGSSTLAPSGPGSQFQDDWDITLPDGLPGVAVGLDVTIQGENREFPLWIVVAREVEPLQDILRSILLPIGVLVALCGIALIILVFRATHLAFKPLVELSSSLRAVDVTKLSHRIDQEELPTELAEIGMTINELLERLEQSFTREQIMTANIAHELKTPITELRTLTEVATSNLNLDFKNHVISESHNISLQMQSIITALLNLGRLKHAEAKANKKQQNLSELVKEEFELLAAQIKARGLTIEIQIAKESTVTMDQELLGMLLRNVIENAVSHSKSDSCINVEFNSGHLTISNDIGNDPNICVDSVAIPFWRGSASRTDNQHAGLGLALVVEIANVCGIEVEVTSQESRFNVDVIFPEEEA